MRWGQCCGITCKATTCAANILCEHWFASLRLPFQSTSLLGPGKAAGDGASGGPCHCVRDPDETPVSSFLAPTVLTSVAT